MTISNERSATDVQADTKRPGWATALGVACGIGVLGVIAFVLGALFPTGGFLQLSAILSGVAVTCALAGGYDYFLYSRKL